jgi:hypothetical protein
MLIVDGQIHLWEKGTPSRHIVRSRTPRSKRAPPWIKPVWTEH